MLTENDRSFLAVMIHAALHADDTEKQALTHDPLKSYAARSEQCSVVSLTCSDALHGDDTEKQAPTQ